MLIVIVVFLQDWRATLVPATTVPVTIIGAFAAMAQMGFTINLLTLFAIVLAIGIVVDDAIVVVEGATQHLERGKTPKQASIDAMSELMGPIVGVTLVLMSVFIPPAFMPGITGQMYRQFALVIAATAFISAINAATLKPTQCALWLRQHGHNRRKNFFFRGFNSVYERLENIYVRLVLLDGAGAADRWRLSACCSSPWPDGAYAGSDRLYPDRGSGLHDGDRAIAGQRLPGTDRKGNGAARQNLQPKSCDRTNNCHWRDVAIGRQCLTCQCRNHIFDAEGLEKRGKGEDLLSIYN